jgi:putative ABC transport system permease protein
MPSNLSAWLRALLRKSELERELDEELRDHIERQFEQNLRLGMNPEEARIAARKAFGGVEQAKERSRDVRGVRWVEEFWQDLRYGARILIKNPGFTLIAVVTLALGVGANTAIFSVVNATLLRPPPYKNPDRIVMVWGTNPGGFGWRGKTGFSAPGFLDYRERNRVFERMATFNGADFTLVGNGSPEPIRGGRVTPEFFEALEVRPMLGRAFLPEDEQAGQDHVALLNYDLWERRFGSDPSVLGRSIRLDEASYTVIGVLPQGFDFSIPDYFRSRDLWVPNATLRDDSDRGHKYLSVIARLKPGVTPGQALLDMRDISERLAREHPDTMTGFGVKVTPLHEQIVGDLRVPLMLLFGAVGFVLLIACANVASLQLARASGRASEIAIRAALGASRGRLLRQLLAESALLALIGGATGLLLAMWGIGLLTKLRPAGIPRETVVTIDFTTLAYSLFLSLGAGIFFGLAPALQAAPKRLGQALKEGGRSAAAGQSGLRLRRLLTISEIALSMTLLVGAGLLIRSFVGLIRVDPGFETRNILTARFDLPNYSYPDETKQAAFYTRAMERIKALPGVVAVGATDGLPPTMGRHTNTFSIEGRAPIDESKESLAVQDRLVTADFFRVMGIPLIEGRVFSEADDSSAAPVALVNRSFARRFFPNESPLGRHLRFGSTKPWMTIVGVVGDTRGFGLDKQPNSEIYLSYHQRQFLPYHPLSNMYLVARTVGDPNNVAAPAMGIARELDKDLTLPTARTMEAVISSSVAERRANMLLLGLFALIALLLTGVGVYGVISYSVSQRTQEIGVRIALGAKSRDVTGLVVKSGMKLALAGIVIGLAGALAMTRWLASMLFMVGATDFLTFAVTATLLAAIALLACWIPARRAARVDPIIALRCE